MEPEKFRIYFWQKVAPLFVLPVFGGMLALTPWGRGWPIEVWYGIGGVAGALVVVYLVVSWVKSVVVLDERGLTVRTGEGVQTWPYEKLIKVKQIGKYRVRMCWDPGIVDQHLHMSIDLWNADGFVDALLDWYAETTGEEMAFPEAA